MAETEEEKKKPRLREKVAEAGLSTLSSIIERRKAKKEAGAKLAQSLVDQSEALISKSTLDRVEMGLPPDLEEQGIPMRSATGLLSETYKPDLAGSDTKELNASMQSEVQGKIPRDYSGRAQAYLEEKKRRVVQGSIARRNPELYPKPGGGGVEDTVPSLLKQVARQRQPSRGSNYES